MQKTKKLSLLLADDHELLLDLWSAVLSNDARFFICGKAPSGTVAIELAKISRPDIALLDINIGPIDGFEVARLIRNFSPRTKIIALSMYSFPAYAKKMKALGAMGYITKNSPVEEVIYGILQANEGNFYYCKQLQWIMQAEEKLCPGKFVEGLTEREIEILRFIKEGYSSKQIADRLHISLRTVDAHRNHIFQKLKVDTLAGLIHAAYAAGL